MDIHLDNPGYGNDPSLFGGVMFISKYGQVPAYCGDFTRTFIKNYLKNIKDGIFLEIGVYGGSTLLDIYEICQNNNISIYGIDPWDKINIFNGQSSYDTNNTVKLQEINRYKVIKNDLFNIINNNNLDIKLINDNSWDVFDNFNDNSIDCIHIDGDHSYNGVKQDLELYFNKIKKGGIIINDDYHWGGVKKAIDEFTIKNKHDIIYTHTIQDGEKHVIIKK
jgi:predicted O-methyltransferase YrrM